MSKEIQLLLNEISGIANDFIKLKEYFKKSKNKTKTNFFLKNKSRSIKGFTRFTTQQTTPITQQIQFSNPSTSTQQKSFISQQKSQSNNNENE